MAFLDETVPETQFAQANGARLAYQVFGSGTENILAVPPLAQNIEIAWEQPEIRAMLERFGSFSTYAVFDKRGTGASGRRSRVPGIDERVEDLRVVMDAVGFEQAHLFAQSDGGPMSILFAATYPDRVQSLTLYGTGAKTNRGDATQEVYELARDRQTREWGTADSRIVDGFAPSRADDPTFRSWHQRYERHCATPDSLSELLDLSWETDVTEALPLVDTPTLVLHNTHERIIPVESGRHLAENIAGATLIEYDRPDHFCYIGDLDPWMADVEKFVTGTEISRKPVTPNNDVRIVTLGRFAVEVNGEEVPNSDWGSRRARQLCKRLVAARGWPVTRDELIDMLWPEESDRQALSARLSVQLSAVRRILGGGVIANRESVRLNLDEVSTDLHDFFETTDDEQIAQQYAGEFLPEDLYDDWTHGSRDEARRRFTQAARAVAAQAATDGNHELVTQLAQQLVASDPYEQEFHLMLIKAHQEAGLAGEARRAHESWSRAMAELDLDVPPIESLS